MLCDHASNDGYGQMLGKLYDPALKEKREAGSLACPRHLYGLHAMFFALYAREIGMDIGFTMRTFVLRLEKAQKSPIALFD